MFTITRILFATAALSTAVSAVFSATSKNNVVTYWGQGANQQRLLTTCQNPNIDIINIGFVDVFPDQGAGGWPGTNFGNACWGDVYQNNGTDTQLLKTCPYIGPDVIACQQTYGKKIFLSIGGGYPNSYYIKTDASGKKFANFLWSAFGPVSASTSTIPRPWGNAVVDGFDFDIENYLDPAPSTNYQSSGYAAMITQFKNKLFPTDTTKSYYISGAPQCVIPDTHFTTVISKAWFDFIWIQFYNTPQCSARAAINKANGVGTYDITYTQWVAAKSLNPNVKMSIGLPAGTGAAIDPSYYLNLNEAQQLIKRFYSQARFGGIMLWEATADQNNTSCGKDYGTWMKTILNARSQNKVAVVKCTTAVAATKRDAVAYPDALAYPTAPAYLSMPAEDISPRPVTYSTIYQRSTSYVYETVTVTSTGCPSSEAAAYSTPAAANGWPYETVWTTTTINITSTPPAETYTPVQAAAVTPSEPFAASPSVYTEVDTMYVAASSMAAAAPTRIASATGWTAASSGLPVPATGGTDVARSNIFSLVLAVVAVSLFV